MEECHLARNLLHLQLELIESRERRAKLRSRTSDLKSERENLEKQLRAPSSQQTDETVALRIQTEAETSKLQLKREEILDQHEEIAQDLKRVDELIGVIRQEMHQNQSAIFQTQVNLAACSSKVFKEKLSKHQCMFVHRSINGMHCKHFR